MAVLLRQRPPPDPEHVAVQELGDLPDPGPMDLLAGLASPLGSQRERPAATAAVDGGHSGAAGLKQQPAPGSSLGPKSVVEHAPEVGLPVTAAAAANAAAGTSGADALPPALAAVPAASEGGREHSTGNQAAPNLAHVAVAAALAAPPRRRQQSERGAADSDSLNENASPLHSPVCTAADGADGGAAREGGSSPDVSGNDGGGGGVSGHGSSPAGGGGDGSRQGSPLDGGGGGGSPQGSPPDGGGDTSPHGERSSMDDEEEEGEEEEEAQQQQQFDTQCAFCDDGGNLLACDGPCMRSFHTGDTGTGKICNKLRLPTDLAELLTTTSDTFRCPNCLAEVQQCFVCKKEGQENKDVFKCIHASCGRYYHPNCAKVEPGMPFACKLHACEKCHKPAERGSKEGELVPCRRCPRAWHRRCLPPDLPLARDQVGGARVWLADYDEEEETWLDGTETSLLYCKRHPLDPETGEAKFVRKAERGQARGQMREVPYNLIPKDLVNAFLLHCARQYRHLASSRHLLAKEAERAKRRREEEAAEAAASEEDLPLATKRRRLIKVGEARKARQPHAAAAVAAAAAAAAEEEEPEPPSQQLAADTAAAAAAATPAVPAVQPQLPAGKGPAEAGEQSESSAATEDAQELGLAHDGEVRQAAPAVHREAASEADRLEAALEQLVHMPSRQRRAERRKRLLQAAEDNQRLTKDALRMATRRPKPYRHPMKKTIDESRLKALEKSVGYAVEKFRSRKLSEAELMQVLDASTVRAALTHYDDLLMVLAPYLHGERYSSYGRHFTSHKLLHDVAERVLVFMRSGDQIVDFSCGENYFVPHLKQLCYRSGLAVRGRAYDIILAKDATDFVLKSWFDAQPWTEGLARPHQLVIGLNPPFGKNNALADRFVRKAAEFQPRLMVLIVPPRTIIPPAYRVVLENSQMCGGEGFYVPGSTHKSWNKEWPVLRILERQEARGMPGVHRELLDCSAALHMQQPFGNYLPPGFAAGYQAYAAPVGQNAYGGYGYAPHSAQMLPQQPNEPGYGLQPNSGEWSQPQQAAYHGPPAAQPPSRPQQRVQGRSRPQNGGRGPNQQRGGKGRGRR